MTIEQFHIEFKVFFDKTDSSAYPEFLDGEIDIYLNEAQDRLIKRRYGKNNIYRAGFEEMQKRTEDLKNLVVTRFAEVSANNIYALTDQNVYRADLSALSDENGPVTDEYQFYLKSSAQTCKNECCSWSRVKLVQHDDISTIALDPFNKPRQGRPLIFFEDGDIFIWAPKGFTVDNFQVTFLRRALSMNIGTYGATKQECELSEHLHKEILQEAIQIAIENIQSPRVQTQGLNTQTME